MVRHTAPQIGEVAGMGLKTGVLKGDGSERLKAFLERQGDEG